MELFVKGRRRREVQGASEVLLELRRLHVAVWKTVVQPLLEVATATAGDAVSPTTEPYATVTAGRDAPAF